MEQKNIRNFAIIAHVDHGKSTLADRLLEITETIPKGKIVNQFLDQNPISRERGITIKLAPVRMLWQPPHYNPLPRGERKEGEGETYTLNLIDTPGHVDFSYEVSRTLAACEGAVLLVDATQGVQAQTVAHLNEASNLNLKIIPAINKIDLASARIDETLNQIKEMFGINKEDVIFVSAKTGENVQVLLSEIIKKIPPPSGNLVSDLRALVFDAVYDEHRGVIAYVKIVDGEVKRGDKIDFIQSKTQTIASSVGFFSPDLISKESLTTGEIGFIVTGVKDIRKVGVGDTVTISNIKYQISNIQPLPGYKRPKPMIFFGMFPKKTSEIIKLKEALTKLSLNDNSLTYTSDYSTFLGAGFKVGFLGILHADIVAQRLKEEEKVDLLLTMPQIVYEKKEDGTLLEPYMAVIIYTPERFVGNVMHLAQKKKGELIDISYFGDNAQVKYDMPFTMLISGLSSDLKSITSGFASLDYELKDYRPAKLKKVDILINGEPIDVLSELLYQEDALYKAREKVKLLKESLPRQQFRQIIQAAIDGQIVAREEISPFRKDVLSKMSGGDRTRKDKLLEAQKKGKSKLSKHSKITLPQEVLFSLIQKD